MTTTRPFFALENVAAANLPCPGHAYKSVKIEGQFHRELWLDGFGRDTFERGEHRYAPTPCAYWIHLRASLPRSAL